MILPGLRKVNACLLAFGTLLIQLHRNNGRKYAYGKTCDQNEFLEKKKKSYYDFLHFYGFKHGRMSDTYR